MTTGSLCLTEILMSRKPCSSKSDASHSADSTSASGVALPYFLSSRAVERAGVDADTDRRAGVLGGPRDLLDLVVELLDVAGVHPDRRAAGLDRGEHVLRLEVDVGDHRDLRLARDRRQRVRVVLRGARDPHDLAAGRRQLGDLLERGADVRRTCRRHRLHRHRCVSAHRHRTDLDLSALPAVGEFGRNGRHAERNRSHLLCNPKVWIKVRSREQRAPGFEITAPCPGSGHIPHVNPLDWGTAGHSEVVPLCPAAVNSREPLVAQEILHRVHHIGDQDQQREADEESRPPRRRPASASPRRTGPGPGA